MLFEELNSLKRNVIMTSVILMSFGVVLLMLPVKYLPAVIEAVGAVMVIIAIVNIFDFLSSNKSLIHFIMLTFSIAIGIGGIAVLVFQTSILFTLGGLFGIILVLGGIHGVTHTWVYARRAGIPGWQVITFLFICLIAIGGIILFNPWWNDPESFKMVIGWSIIFSAIISMLRLIWEWPIQNA